MEALKESFALVTSNLATSIVAYLVIMLVTTASTIIIGVIVLAPFVMLFSLGLYERLNGRWLPEPTRA
ncbi:hypothetical protein [Brachybacterium sp. Z12]|uniref:hypothetical protein n=1 Tax=Brachybacterium sp. Z12 TaxID=2759167 RepID=UPI00223B66CB|nr:hypothetical protein [Brachybacterium sp. Z12]